MVFFCCDGCGETLKKSQVDAHAYKCRSCESVSCVDCNVSFWGDDYRAHTSCVTEAERYEKSVYKGPKTKSNNNNHTKNNKVSPQEKWTQLISKASSSSSSDPSLQSYFYKLSQYTNVPRKEKQFRNFTINSLNLKDYGKSTANQDLVTEMWNFLAELRNKEVNAVNAEKISENTKIQDTKATSITTLQKEASVSKIEKEYCQPEIDSPNACNDVSKSKTRSKYDKKIVKGIKKVLKKAPMQQLKIKKLQKEVCRYLQREEPSSFSSKTNIKETIKLQIKNAHKKFFIDGKLVTLRVS